jgi:hypothetical protein
MEDTIGGRCHQTKRGYGELESTISNYPVYLRKIMHGVVVFS